MKKFFVPIIILATIFSACNKENIHIKQTDTPLTEKLVGIKGHEIKEGSLLVRLNIPSNASTEALQEGSLESLENSEFEALLKECGVTGITPALKVAPKTGRPQKDTASHSGTSCSLTSHTDLRK